jgi:hypothetical protein
LSQEPEEIYGSIKRLRGKTGSDFSLASADYRVFHDVAKDRVEIFEILHKPDSAVPADAMRAAQTFRSEVNGVSASEQPSIIGGST